MTSNPNALNSSALADQLTARLNVRDPLRTQLLAELGDTPAGQHPAEQDQSTVVGMQPDPSQGHSGLPPRHGHGDPLTRDLAKATR
ncbi:hypothetical protein [Amycolatopsis anabasis]|uniref:hypothetical protein n=1 Tax=Amycolatopsis anabasis TaxID=1840409 RepID=UPI00131C4ED1|nr:hypothetical protein [Amycolatopsis anabasis]